MPTATQTHFSFAKKEMLYDLIVGVEFFVTAGEFDKAPVVLVGFLSFVTKPGPSWCAVLIFWALRL